MTKILVITVTLEPEPFFARGEEYTSMSLVKRVEVRDNPSPLVVEFMLGKAIGDAVPLPLPSEAIREQVYEGRGRLSIDVVLEGSIPGQGDTSTPIARAPDQHIKYNLTEELEVILGRVLTAVYHLLTFPVVMTCRRREGED